MQRKRVVRSWTTKMVSPRVEYSPEVKQLVRQFRIRLMALFKAEARRVRR